MIDKAWDKATQRVAKERILFPKGPPESKRQKKIRLKCEFSKWVKYYMEELPNDR